MGHGLGAVPKMFVVKPMDAVEGWAVYHSGIGNTGGVYWNQNIAVDTGDYYWNDTTPTSSVFTLHDHVLNNGSGNNMIAYCFAEVEGFSKIGSYTGTGSAGSGGAYIHTGFKPAWVMLKRTDSGGEWEVSDRVRDPDNPVRLILQPNSSGVEWDSTTRDIDWLSNGFKHRSSHADFNASGGTYIYLALAETAFKHATAR